MIGNGDTGGERTLVVRSDGGIGFFGSMVLMAIGMVAGAWLMPSFGSVADFAQELYQLSRPVTHEGHFPTRLRCDSSW